VLHIPTQIHIHMYFVYEVPPYNVLVRPNLLTSYLFGIYPRCKPALPQQKEENESANERSSYFVFSHFHLLPRSPIGEVGTNSLDLRTQTSSDLLITKHPPQDLDECRRTNMHTCVGCEKGDHQAQLKVTAAVRIDVGCVPALHVSQQSLASLHLFIIYC
jgi:hypothetical protein